MTSQWEGFRELLGNLSGPVDMSPEAVARREAETQAHRQKLKEQAARREAFWALIGSRETCLYTSDDEVYYAVYVDYAITWDGATPTVELEIRSDGYPSQLRLTAAAALALMPGITAYSQSATLEHFTVRGYDVGRGREGYFNLNRETMLNLLKWLTQEESMLQHLAKETAHE